MHKRIIEPLLREVERMVIFEKFMVQSLAKRFFIFLGLKFNLSYKKHTFLNIKINNYFCSNFKGVQDFRRTLL